MTRPGPRSEQISQASPGMADPRALPGAEEIQSREVQKIVDRLTRARASLMPVAALFLGCIVIFDPATWKVWTLAVFVALFTAFEILDLRRMRRPGQFRPYVDLGIGLVLQTGLIWMTGAVESPLLVIYIPLALISGVALGPTIPRWRLLFAIATLIWAMALTGLFGWVPRTVPRFLDLGPGFYNRATYVVVKAGVMTLAVTIASQIGSAVHRFFLGVLEQAIAARQQAMEVLLERNRELIHLSSSIAHELKNPLASIQGLVQLLDRAPSKDERERSRLQVLLQEVGRMRTTLDEFLNFSRPLGELTLEEVDLAELFRRLSALHEGIAEQRGVHLVLPEVESHPLRCDPRKVSQALVNLLQNALEATPRGGTIEWFIHPSEERVLFGVRDTGPGLSPELLPRPTGLGATTKPKGSGIGLAVARAIAEQHGGELLLANLPERGCQAALSLPRRLRIEQDTQARMA